MLAARRFVFFKQSLEEAAPTGACPDFPKPERWNPKRGNANAMRVLLVRT